MEFNGVKVVYALIMCGSERQEKDGRGKTKSWNSTILGKLVITQPVKNPRTLPG
jgi:hypothetical protein